MALVRQERRVIRTDHWQFVLDAHGPPDTWLSETQYGQLKTGCAESTGTMIVVATGRLSGETLVEVELHTSEPPIDASTWDEVTRLALRLDHDVVDIYAPEMTGSDLVWNLKVPSGNYGVAVLAGGLTSITDDVGGIGDDHYRVLLWPA